MRQITITEDKGHVTCTPSDGLGAVEALGLLDMGRYSVYKDMARYEQEQLGKKSDEGASVLPDKGEVDIADGSADILGLG